MNANAVFNYKENKIIIQCNSDDKMINICKKFSTKIDADVNSKIYLQWEFIKFRFNIWTTDSKFK